MLVALGMDKWISVGRDVAAVCIRSHLFYTPRPLGAFKRCPTTQICL